MKILMLYPKIPQQTFWNVDREIRFVYKKQALFPPLGLLTIGAYLPDDFQIRLADRNVAEETDSDWDWADIVFISAMLVQQEDYGVCIASAKRRGTPIAVGGPFTNSAPERVARDADWICFGEAEDVIDQLIDDLRADKRGRVYRGSTDTDLESLKPPRFDLIDVTQYNHMAVQFSRGCPYNCEFCDIIEIYGRRPRTKRPDQVLEELERLKRLGHRGPVFIVDDNFIGNPKRANALLRALAVWNRENEYPFFYYTEVSLNISRYPDLLSNMSEANFRNIFVGIETPDPKLLQTAQKKQNLLGDQGPLDKLRTIREQGIHIMGGFIIGFDGETRDIFDIQRAFIQDSGIAVAMIGLLQAIPHTQLSRRLKRQGRLLDSVDAMGNITIDGINFVPKGEMTKREYLRRYAELVKDLFEPKAFFDRSLRAALQLRRPNKSEKIRKAARKAPLQAIRKIASAVFPYAYHVGTRGKGARLLFWRSLLTVMRENPSALDAFLLDCFYFLHLNPHSRFVHRELAGYLAHVESRDVLDVVICTEAVQENQLGRDACAS
jgi:radical SAM superfamily enzyme YgiQ (UPF0313 family)